MPLEALSVDTSTKEFDFNALNGIGLAIIAGKTTELGDNGYKAMLVPVAQQYNGLASWLSDDIVNRIPFIEKITSALSFARDVEQTIEFPVQQGAIKVGTLISSMNKLIPLAREDETLRLAQRVVEMEPDERSIEEWAGDLSKQISKGWD